MENDHKNRPHDLRSPTVCQAGQIAKIFFLCNFCHAATPSAYVLTINRLGMVVELRSVAVK